MLEIEKYIKKHVGRKVLVSLTFSPSPSVGAGAGAVIPCALEWCSGWNAGAGA